MCFELKPTGPGSAQSALVREHTRRVHTAFELAAAAHAELTAAGTEHAEAVDALKGEHAEVRRHHA